MPNYRLIQVYVWLKISPLCSWLDFDLSWNLNCFELMLMGRTNVVLFVVVFYFVLFYELKKKKKGCH